MILSGFDQAVQDGRITSTSRRLSHADFAEAMATVEKMSGGQITIKGKAGPAGQAGGYKPGYWQAAADDNLQRMRRKAHYQNAALERAGVMKPDGEGLRGWIRARIAREHRTDQLSALDYHELHALINSLRAFAKRHNVHGGE